ncbi:RIKEN cDNA 1600002H07, isoform CRA_a [Mus musculus]|nr:RIKEN cDNA 1600002H07, isoform CRA_a [Mus musculus]
MLGVKGNYLLPADCAHRLVAELQGALDSCADRQRQLERSLRVSRRLLQVWEPARTPSPVPETKEEDPSPACAPSSQDLEELELLTQALEKAVRVRKGVSNAGQRDRTPTLTSKAATSGAAAASHPRAPSRGGSRVLGTRSTKGIQRATAPAKDYPEHRLRSKGDKTHVRTQDQTTGYGPDLRDQQMTPSSAHHTTELFTLKEKGTLLQLPEDFRKAVSRNSWPSATEVEVHAQILRKACMLLRLRMQKELATAPTDWMQEYRCLLTLEGLQTVVGQCLHRIQVLQAAVTEQLPGECLAETRTQASSVCGGEVDSACSPELLLYASTEELQTLATLKLQVALLHQQIHLEKVLMAELLPLINTQDPGGPPWLALCRATYSLLCEGGERFLTVLRDDPAD